MNEESTVFKMDKKIVFAKYESQLIAVGYIEKNNFQPKKKLFISHI